MGWLWLKRVFQSRKRQRSDELWLSICQLSQILGTLWGLITLTSKIPSLIFMLGLVLAMFFFKTYFLPSKITQEDFFGTPAPLQRQPGRSRGNHTAGSPGIGLSSQLGDCYLVALWPIRLLFRAVFPWFSLVELLWVGCLVAHFWMFFFLLLLLSLLWLWLWL